MNTELRVDPETLLKYAKQWVAISDDRSTIVAIGQSIPEVESKLTVEQLTHVVLKYVPAPEQVLSPQCRS